MEARDLGAHIRGEVLVPSIIIIIIALLLLPNITLYRSSSHN